MPLSEYEWAVDDDLSDLVGVAAVRVGRRVDRTGWAISVAQRERRPDGTVEMHAVGWTLHDDSGQELYGARCRLDDERGIGWFAGFLGQERPYGAFADGQPAVEGD